jgi:hypothetical protein
VSADKPPCRRFQDRIYITLLKPGLLQNLLKEKQAFRYKSKTCWLQIEELSIPIKRKPVTVSSAFFINNLDNRREIITAIRLLDD